MNVRDWKGTAKMTVKKLSEIIGTTGDTGGTAAAGTLMAKVNAILKGQGTQAAESTSQEILSKVSNGVKVDFRSPISSKHWSSSSGTAVTGTGKGIAYFALAINNKYTLKVDGVTLINNAEPEIGGIIPVEFTSSFSIKGMENYSNKGFAIFY